MSVLLLVFVVIVVLAIAIYAITHLPIVGEPWRSILIVIACLAAIIVIVQRVGLA